MSSGRSCRRTTQVEGSAAHGQQPPNVDSTQGREFFTPALRIVVMVVLLFTAFGIRLYHITDPPFDFHPTRQFRSALIARGFYYEGNPTIPEWKREVAHVNKERQGTLEPPIMERAASLAYRIVGGERLWIPRMLSCLFWVIGVAPLYRLAKSITGSDGALVCATFYLLIPFGVSASRTFQPDPLMVMLFVATIFAIYRYYDRRSTRAYVAAVAVSAAAMFVKPVCVFPIAAAFVVPGLCEHGARAACRNPRFWVFLPAGLVPTILYYIGGIMSGGMLKSQAQGTFSAALLADGRFWIGWIGYLAKHVGLTTLVIALLGVALARPGLPRRLFVGLWIGYLVFCLVFDYHIASHDYYHMLLMPIVALSIAPVASLILQHLAQACTRWHSRGCILLVFVLAVGLGMYLSPWMGQLDNDRRASAQSRVLEAAREIGDAVGHSTRTVFLAAHYGKSLEYYAHISGTNWPTQTDTRTRSELFGKESVSADDRLTRLITRKSAEFFIATGAREFKKQSDLAEYLNRNFPALAREPQYLIFDLRRRLRPEEE